MAMRGGLIGAAVATLVLASTPQASAQARWAPAWAFSPSSTTGPALPPRTPARPDPRGPIGPATVTDATLTQMFQVATGGTRVRLRVSNRFGTSPLHLGSVTLARAAENGQAGGTPVDVTFDGSKSITLTAGMEWLSDPVDFRVAALENLTISVTYPGEARLPAHVVRQWITTAAEPEPVGMRLGAVAAGLEVETDRPLPVIVTLGDSITEGVGSTPGRGGWPEAYNARLIEAGAPWTVINAGIGGNRLLYQSTGPSALERLSSDALAVPGVRCLIVMEGINDIARQSLAGFEHQPASVEAMIGAYRQIIARAHAAGLKIVGATLTPYEGAYFATPEGEQIRQALNHWIRTSGAFDAMIDFDALLRDPASPNRLKAAFDSGDLLHPSDAGYAAMSAGIPLDVCN